MAAPGATEARQRADAYMTRTELPTWVAARHLQDDWSDAAIRDAREALANFISVYNGTANKSFMRGRYTDLHRELVITSYVPGETQVFADWVRQIFPWADVNTTIEEAIELHRVAVIRGTTVIEKRLRMFTGGGRGRNRENAVLVLAALPYITEGRWSPQKIMGVMMRHAGWYSLGGHAARLWENPPLPRDAVYAIAGASDWQEYHRGLPDPYDAGRAPRPHLVIEQRFRDITEGIRAHISRMDRETQDALAAAELPGAIRANSRRLRIAVGRTDSEIAAARLAFSSEDHRDTAVAVARRVRREFATEALEDDDDVADSFMAVLAEPYGGTRVNGGGYTLMHYFALLTDFDLPMDPRLVHTARVARDRHGYETIGDIVREFLDDVGTQSDANRVVMVRTATRRPVRGQRVPSLIAHAYVAAAAADGRVRTNYLVFRTRLNRTRAMESDDDRDRKRLRTEARFQACPHCHDSGTSAC